MRKSTSAAALAAFVMSGSIPAGLIIPWLSGQSFSQSLCKGVLGVEWAGSGRPGSCDGTAAAQAAH